MPKLPFNLCQPGATSCGACCGLYNFKGHERAALAERLQSRTTTFSRLQKTRAAWEAEAREIRRREREAGGSPLTQAEPLCPLLGFLDDAQRRIGCLGHPLVTRGPDLRDCGNFNAEACEEFLCASFEALTVNEAELVRQCCGDWYLYGLVITDPEFVRACLALVSARSSGRVDAARLRTSARAAEALGRLFALKHELPPRTSAPPVLGRSPDTSGLGH
ncbi:MAG: hypothetical protein ACK4N5_13645, partial [Myxococcales bacterium]